MLAAVSATDDDASDAGLGGTTAAAPDVPTRIMTVPTSTVSPSATRIAETVPANGDGSSTSDLAVSISTSTWLISTVSPVFTFHATISASVRPSPTSGSRNSESAITGSLKLVRQSAVDGLEHAVSVRKVEALELGRG